MIINKLTICNIRNYIGQTNVDLSVKGKKNLILFGGLNGAGKTTFADSIRLCLYGHSFYGKIMSDTKYQEFLADFCTNTKDITEAFIEMNITIDEENPPITMDIKRQFQKNTHGFIEKLTLKKGGSSIELIDENYWSYYIEKLIPPNVSRYFFFDGENVKAIIASDNSSKYLLDAIKNLSGVSELENLNKDLNEVRKNIQSKTKKKSDLELINSLHERITYHQTQIESIEEKIQKKKDELSIIESKKNDLNVELARLSGANESKKRNLYDSLKKLSAEYSELDESVVDFCYNRILYAAAIESLERSICQAKKENENQINSYSVETLQSILLSGSADSILHLGQNASEQAIMQLIENISSKKDKTISPILDVSLSQISQMESMFVSKDEIDSFQTDYETRESISHEMKNIQKKIEKINDESFNEFDTELKQLNSEIEQSNISIMALQSEKESNIQKKEDLSKELILAEHAIVLEDVDRATIDTINKVQQKIGDRIASIIDNTKCDLTKKINTIYNVLKNNEDMVKEIKLSDSYDLLVYNFDNKLLNIRSLSEGEKSILMYSVVYGLHSLSNCKFPLIIDSPIGRMDSIHSDNLANKLYTTISNQLILLSHNREIIGSLHDVLRPLIANEYTITKYGIPKITPGYFD